MNTIEKLPSQYYLRFKNNKYSHARMSNFNSYVHQRQTYWQVVG